MNAAAATASAGVFVWLGMVLAISFIEAPLKFRAPGVTIRIGVGIGRLVFRALNACEVALALGIATAMLVGDSAAGALAWLGVVIGLLTLQLGVVRPRLSRRSAVALTGGHERRSHAHLAYVVLEVAKALALAATGVLLLTH
jgi:hypothetical protein